MKRVHQHKFRLWAGASLLIITSLLPLPNQAQDKFVRCILFYSPTCPHCHEVITQSLPPLLDLYGGTPEVVYIPPTSDQESVGPALVGMYGDTVEILYINTLTPLGQDLFAEAVERYQIPAEDQVVPLMIIGQTLLTGSGEIPQRFSEIVDEGIAAGGINWPELPGLDDAISQLVQIPTEEDQGSPQPTEEVAGEEIVDIPQPTGAITSPIDESQPPTMIAELSALDKFRVDPVGNSIAVLILTAMLTAVGLVGARAVRVSAPPEHTSPSYLIPFLCLAGIAIAGYLTYIETSGNLAVCGPVGDCNAVQQSQYARLFGLIPIGLLGLIGYLTMGLTWLISRRSSSERSPWANLGLFVLASIGIVFSIYLTFLEPFVIGASCAWCLSSAVIMTAIFWLSKDVGVASLHQIGKR